MPSYHVTIAEKEYTVEVPDPRERPVRAIVDGEVIEVRLETAAAPTATPLTSPTAAPRPAPAPRAALPAAAGDIAAPLPGVVIEILVNVGDQVEPGQQLCTLEAMKMNNPIRSTVTGTVETVHITVGQQVQHGASLFTLKS